MQAAYQRFIKSAPGTIKVGKDVLEIMPRKFRPKMEEKMWKSERFSKIVSDSRFYAIFHCHQIPDYTVLRNSIAAQGGKVFVIKHSIAKKVCESVNLPELNEISALFQGPSVFVYLDPDTSEKGHLFHKGSKYGEQAITKLARTLERNPDFMFMGACLDGGFINRQTFLPLMKDKNLSGIQMLGSTLSSLPHMKITQALQSHQTELGRVLEERCKQLDPNADTTTESEEAPAC